MSNVRDVIQSGPPTIWKSWSSYARRTRSCSGTFEAVNRPPADPTLGMAKAPRASGLLGFTDATSKAGPAGDWAAGWDARPSITARHATTTTLFIPSRYYSPGRPGGEHCPSEVSAFPVATPP